MAISPPSDIVLDVARAAEPATLETARARLASRAAAMASGLAEAFSVGETGAPLSRETSTDGATPKSYVDFEAMVLQTFVQSMMPKDAEDVYGEGMAGDMWKSMMSQQLGTVMADRGGIGIADSLIKGHYHGRRNQGRAERRFERSGKGPARPGTEPVDGTGPGNAAAADVKHCGRHDAVDGPEVTATTRGGRHA